MISHAMASLRKLQSLKEWGDLLILSVCLLLAFGSALIVSYGHTDDYSVLFHHQQGWRQMTIDWHTASGRPIFALLDDWLFNQIDTVAGLAGLRAIGLLLLIGLGWLIRRRLHYLDLPRFESTLLATACVLTPCAAIFVGWSMLAVSMVAGLVAMIAAEFADKAWSVWRGEGNENSGVGYPLFWLGASILALLVSLLIYQPLAPLFLFSAVLGFAFGRKAGRGGRYLLWASAVYVSAIGIYYAIFKLLIFPAQVQNAHVKAALERGGFDFSPLRSLDYVFVEILPMVFGGWEYFRDGIHLQPLALSVRWTVTMVALAGLVPVALWRLSGERDEKFFHRAGRIATVFMVWGISLLPMVILKNQYAPIRTLFFSYGFVCLLAYVGLKQLSQGQPWPRWAIISALLLLTTQAGLGFWGTLVRVQSREFALLREAVLNFPSRPAALVFKSPPLEGCGLNYQLPSRHEYSLLSSSVPWMPKSLVNLVWNQKENIGRGNSDNSRLRFTEVYLMQSGQPSPDPNVPIIDAEALLCEKPSRL